MSAAIISCLSMLSYSGDGRLASGGALLCSRSRYGGGGEGEGPSSTAYVGWTLSPGGGGGLVGGGGRGVWERDSGSGDDLNRDGSAAGEKQR